MFMDFQQSPQTTLEIAIVCTNEVHVPMYRQHNNARFHAEGEDLKSPQNTHIHMQTAGMMCTTQHYYTWCT